MPVRFKFSSIISVLPPVRVRTIRLPILHHILINRTPGEFVSVCAHKIEKSSKGHSSKPSAAHVTRNLVADPKSFASIFSEFARARIAPPTIRRRRRRVTSRRRDMDRGETYPAARERVKVSGSMRPRPGIDIGNTPGSVARRPPLPLMLLHLRPILHTSARRYYHYYYY